MNKRFSWRCGLCLLGILIFLPVCGRSQAYSDFPYVSDFGTSAAPGADNSLYQYTCMEGEGSTGGWEMKATAAQALYPTYTVSGNYTYSTLVTRPFSLTAGTTYRLAVVYETDALLDDALYMWRLAPENPDNPSGLGYDVVCDPAGEAPLIYASKAGLPLGEHGPETYEFTVAASGNYALSFTIYAAVGDMFEDFDDSRHLLIKSINVSQKSPYDLAMGKIVTPYSHHQNASQAVSAWVRNDGTATETGFSLCYTVGTQVRVEQTFQQTLAPGAEALVTFDEPARLSSGANRIRVFLTGRPAGDPKENDTAQPHIVTLYDEAYQAPCTFTFDDNTLNQRWTVLHDGHTDRTTWRFGPQNDRSCAYIATDETDNNARLVSPSIALEAGQTYRFRFSYTGLSTLSEKIAVYMTGADFLDADRMTGYWKDEGFSNQGEYTATFFYTAATAGEHHVVWKAYSDDISGGIALWNVDVATYEPMQGDFYYEFDPMDADLTASSLLASSAYFIDRNHNGSAWRLVNDPVFNGESAIRAGEAFGQVADDWMVFHPMYLEGGKTYTLSVQARTGGTNRQVSLESLICRAPFAFGEASDRILVGSESLSRNTFGPLRHTFSVPESGNYLLAFRYQANIEQGADIKEEDYSLYLDHIGLFEEERRDLELAYVDIPVGAQMGQRNVYIRCGYRNFGPAIAAGDLTFYYRVGRQAVVAEPAVRAVAEGGIGQHNFNTTADFSQDTLNEVRVWAQNGLQVLTDTFKVTVHSLNSREVPYRDLLTDETKDAWRIASLAVDPSWHFVTEDAYDAPYAARTDASDGVLDDYLVLPPLQLHKDTVYMVAFYAKASQDRADESQAGLRLAYSTNGYGVTNFDKTIGRVSAMTTAYQPYYFYFKSQENSPTFVAFHSTLPFSSGHNWIDHVVVLDSVSASYTYMALTEVSYRRVTGCDDDRTTEVEVTLRNQGYLACDTVPIFYQMDGLPVQTFRLENGMADLSERRFKLPERWDLSEAGNHRLRIWVDMPREADRKDDTLTVAFRADDMAQLPLGYDFENGVMPGNVEDRNGDRVGWELRRNADSAYAGRYYVQYRGTGSAADDDWKLPCFWAEAGEYTLDFYMSAPFGSEEQIEISLLHYDVTDAAGELARTVLLDTVIRHMDYVLYQLPFKVSAGHYGVLFHIKSEADGRTLCIDNLTIADYGLRDVAVVSILSPVEAAAYDELLEVQVQLRNNGRVAVRDVPLILTVNDEEVQSVEVPVLEGGEDLVYTFPSPIDLREPGTYRIAVYTNWVLDLRPGNNRQTVVRTQGLDMDLALTVMTEPMAGRKPYSAAETVKVRVENRGRSSSTEVPITVVMNGSRRIEGRLPVVAVGTGIVYEFEETVDMSASSWYEFSFFLSPDEPDGNPLNDTLYSRIDGRYEAANEAECLAGDGLLYPNPARDVLHIDLPAGFTRIDIYSIQGQLYLSRETAGAVRMEVPVAAYPEGLYILKLTGPAGEKDIKWIKAR